jgi:hypothetical protein
MHHNTYDRFCGSWWGSIIGQTILHPADNPFTQPWLIERRQIAEMLLTQEFSTINLTNLTNLTKLFSSLGIDAVSMTDKVNGLNFSSNLLSWLPLIIFQTDKQNLSLELTKKSNLQSVNSTGDIYLSQDMSIWAYLLTSVLNHQMGLLDKKLVTEEIFQHNLMPVNPLTEKLNIVFKGIKSGSSLQQLTQQLSSPDRLQATAIALAWYCFATTPHDFKLSVGRAASLECNLAWLTTALTATLSGAYNGMTVISHNWRTQIKQSQSWNLENQLLLKLFRSWLGIYNVEGEDQFYNLELDAIAPAQFIQSRQSLKIISLDILSLSHHSQFI